MFSKAADELDDLPTRISRVHYVNSFGQEILPPANPRAIQAIQQANAVIYSIGSLYTSIVPNLVLRGIGEAMRKSQSQTKILILNGCLDREVGPVEQSRPFTAADFIDAIVKAGEQSRGFIWSGTSRSPIKEEQKRPSIARTRSEGHQLKRDVDLKILPPPMLASAMPSRVPSPTESGRATPVEASFTPSRSSSRPHSIYKHYVTHLIHLPNSDGTPYVDKDVLASQYGVKCIRVYGRRNSSGPGMLYDAQALRGAIEAVLGAAQKESEVRDALSSRRRRNTVEG